MCSQLRQETDGRRITAAALRRSPFFREVPESVLVPLAAVSSRQALDHGAVLWQPDDVIEVVVVLAAGVIRLYRYLDNGEEVTVALLDRGQVCGLAGLDAAFLPTTVAQSLTEETVVYRIPRRPFAAFLLANPAVALRALTTVCRRSRTPTICSRCPTCAPAWPMSSRTWQRPTANGWCGRRTRSWRSWRTAAARRSPGKCCRNCEGTA